MDTILEFINGLLEHTGPVKEYLVAAGAVVVASKGITILTPTKVDDNILGGLGKAINLVLKVLNTTSLNIFKDKNADAS